MTVTPRSINSPKTIWTVTIRLGNATHERRRFLKEMSQDKTIGKIPTILITATAGRGTAWLAGAAAYLRKPFSEGDLKTAMKRVLEPSTK
jgi:CheY-like chemotaxis protein